MVGQGSTESSLRLATEHRISQVRLYKDRGGILFTALLLFAPIIIFTPLCDYHQLLQTNDDSPSLLQCVRYLAISDRLHP